MKEYVIVVAGGMGRRMGSEIPKQFLLLSGIPILMRTLDVFYRYSNKIQIILVLPKDLTNYWNNLCIQYKFAVPHQITAGGASRYKSVKNGLAQIREPDALVAIHDGVRPLVTTSIISTSFAEATKFGSAITAVNLTESIRQLYKNKSKAVDRDDYKLVQTPQTFRFALIKHAYDIKDIEYLTDDSVVAEKAGVNIHLIEGSYENIKITTKNDLSMAETIVKSHSPNH